jgi:hypothetical protein
MHSNQRCFKNHYQVVFSAKCNSCLYFFTSSLPVQIIKYFKPTLSPLVNRVVEYRTLHKASEKLPDKT